mgnify:CR=1 FL=1
MPGVPWHTQILAAQLTLFQPGGTDYAHLITTGTPGFSDLPTALKSSDASGSTYSFLGRLANFQAPTHRNYHLIEIRIRDNKL